MSAPYSLLRGVVVFTTVLVSLWQPSVSLARLTAGRDYFATPFVLADSSCQMVLRPDADSYVVDVRAAMNGIGERVGMAPNYWGISVIFPNDTLGLTLRHGNTAFGDILDHRQSILTINRGGNEIWSDDVSAFDGFSGGYNTLQLLIDTARGQLEVRGGGKKMTDVFASDMSFATAPQSVSLWSKGPLTVASFSVETAVSPAVGLATGWTADSLRNRLRSSSDPIEGFWQYLDRENNPQYARLGGRYLLAVVKNATDDAYDIIYVGGAETYASEWTPMMLKGRLKPTIFLDHYDLEWVDSTFERMNRDIHAQLTDGAILSLSFPLLKTTVRFSKMPLK